MATPEISYPHLSFASGDGFPVVERVRFKVIHLVAHHVAHGWSPEELVWNFPQLTLGEVYSALAWFSDHRQEVLERLEQGASEARAMGLEGRHRRIEARLREQEFLG